MIRLNKQTDYGIVLMTAMAEARDQHHSATELSTLTRLPQPMVSKILKLLVHGRLLDSTRGPKGGYRLARPARDINVAAIIVALDGPIAITECVEDADGECSYEAFCSVRTNWQRINFAVREALEQISLEEMTQPLVGLPAPAAADRAATQNLVQIKN